MTGYSLVGHLLVHGFVDVEMPDAECGLEVLLALEVRLPVLHGGR